ncbi:ATP-dependent nuclease [Longimicrobium sp.]|uniref:ATP-dependent nuclease n=1 Tax=Longimicrobium sp. TaxID=2029185 RepID=UPI002E2FFCF4|nr:AAA family ATPase [Longimicrobium sp.]HEX6038949.1 AAA family ATPase [Longimicrobium sp.]
MLRTVALRFGAGEGDEPLRFSPGPMTVFVGPNNSGKSLALREIEDFIETGGDSLRYIVKRLELLLPPAAQIEEMVVSRATGEDEELLGDVVRVMRLRSPGGYSRRRATDTAEPVVEQEVDLPALLAAAAHAGHPSEEELERICRDLLGLFTLRLDGQTRLALTQMQPAGDLESHPTNHLGALFRDDEARARIREITADAFGLYFVIDPTEGTHFRVRMAERAPMDDDEEQSISDRSRAFHGRATDIDHMSDGIRAFTGLTAAVLSADYRIMLVDEPEAFLHPPLIRKLGKRLTQLAAERGANLLAATHSPDFVMGCITSGHAINIVRLTYRKGIPGARLLPAGKLETMMRDPLLRSTGVLGALFHEGAVVCEADADRVFYAEVNERLLAHRAGGADGVVFLNAQNKQTVRRIIRPLREMGLPAAAVLDLDLLKGREDFRDLLQSAFVPEVFWEPWEEQRRRLHQQMNTADYKDGGIYRLGGEPRELADQLLALLAEYGVFLVPNGELECWLPELEVGGHGPEWLTQVFTKMGTDPSDAAYKKPTQSGVWRFIQNVARWIADPWRKGMRAESVPLDHRLAPPGPDDKVADAVQPEPEERQAAVA